MNILYYKTLSANLLFFLSLGMQESFHSETHIAQYFKCIFQRHPRKISFGKCSLSTRTPAAIDTPFLLICKVLTFHEHLRFPLQFGYRTSILLSFSSVSLSLLYIAFSYLMSTSFFLGNMGSVFLMLNTVIQTCAPEVNWKHIIAKNE